ncbi:MAG: nuclear transport factor 2 family protein [Rhodocyclaceae bacterium]
MSGIAETLISLEEERCRCIVEQDYARLRTLLSPALIHTHTRGNVDDIDSYLVYIGSVIESLELRREGIKVIPLGPDVAMMHGKQINRARRRGHMETVVVEATVTQVWQRESDGNWRQVAFHASPLGAPPPAVPR